MLGSDLVRYLSKRFDITSINRENYQTFIGKSFNIVVNANGNSKRFRANRNPVDDFFASTASVYKSIFDFPSDIYIYISSPDVYENHTGVKYTKETQKINVENLSSYGFHKNLSELIVKKYKEKFLILRPSMILGTNLKKGPIYDVIQSNPLFITLKTKLQLITTRAIAEIIETLLQNFITNEIVNVGGIGTFSFLKVGEYFDKKIEVLPKAERQIYEMNVEKIKNLYPALKTSEGYLQEFLKSLKS